MTSILRSSWMAITKHPLRSTLAMLGVAIGVCALTSIMSVENSWRNAVVDYFKHMDMETVKVELPAGSNWREQGFRRSKLDMSDIEAIRMECPAVGSITPMMTGIVRAETHDSSLEIGVRSVKADFTDTLPDKVREGRFITDEEEKSRTPVCMLSYEARVWLFGDEPAVGQKIRLDGHPFSIVGVISGNKHIGVGTRSVYIPFGQERSLVASNSLFSPRMEIFVRAHDIKAATKQIERLMRKRLGGDESRSFTTSLWEIRETALRARMRVTLYSGLAGLCALLAAGIGIAALLFVSVTESSREIGIRRALGATRFTIYAEYVLSAVLLTALGGALGGVLGIPASAVGAFAVRWQPVIGSSGDLMTLSGGAKLPSLSDITTSVSWEALGIAVILALVTGVVAALAPASEASAIEPARAISRRAGTEVRPREFLTIVQVMFGVLVLILLTSYYSVLENQEREEARDTLGQDRISATADPIAAMRKPFDNRYIKKCRDIMAEVLTSSEKMAEFHKNTPLLTSVTPQISRPASVAYGAKAVESAKVVFTTAEAFDYKPFMPKKTKQEVADAFQVGQPVAVIDPNIKEQLFGPGKVVGRTIKVFGGKYTVLAVRNRSEDWFRRGNVLIPIQFYRSVSTNPVLDHSFIGSMMSETKVFGRPIDTRQYAQAAAQLKDALLPLLPEEYRKTIKFSEEIPENTRQFIFQHKATAIRGAVGALAVLLVALIGLANMLLVSVHESMREIGLRRAMGAQRVEVFRHFLSKGVILASIGASGGLGIGMLICRLARTLTDLPVTVSIFWAVIGAVGAILAGALVSIPPALAAARIPPVEALRYE